MGGAHQEFFVGTANFTAVVNNNEKEQITAVIARRRRLASSPTLAALCEAETETQFVSFNFTNPLICVVVSSAATAGFRQHTNTHRCC
jgi:hypothetical protein